MPQIKLTTGFVEIIDLFKKEDIGRLLIEDIERVWPATREDVTFTLIKAEQVINECDIQIVLNYTVGYQYQSGVKFNPSKKNQEEAIDALGETLKRLIPNHDILMTVLPYFGAITKVF